MPGHKCDVNCFNSMTVANQFPELVQQQNYLLKAAKKRKIEEPKSDDEGEESADRKKKIDEFFHKNYDANGNPISQIEVQNLTFPAQTPTVPDLVTSHINFQSFQQQPSAAN